jgi:cell division protein FtsZ
MNTNIKVIGVGGAGCNAVSRMASCKIQGVELIAINCDAQDLQRTRAHKKIRLLRPDWAGEQARERLPS